MIGALLKDVSERLSLNTRPKIARPFSQLSHKYFSVTGRCCCTRYLDFSEGRLILPLDNWELVPALHFASVIVFSGHISNKMLEYILSEKKTMSEEVEILVLGSCAKKSIGAGGVGDRFKLSLYVAGCPLTEIEVTKQIKNWIAGER